MDRRFVQSSFFFFVVVVFPNVSKRPVDSFQDGHKSSRFGKNYMWGVGLRRRCSVFTGAI